MHISEVWFDAARSGRICSEVGRKSEGEKEETNRANMVLSTHTHMHTCIQHPNKVWLIKSACGVIHCTGVMLHFTVSRITGEHRTISKGMRSKIVYPKHLLSSYSVVTHEIHSKYSMKIPVTYALAASGILGLTSIEISLFHLIYSRSYVFRYVCVWTSTKKIILSA